jgi:hypothetical protein
MFFAAVQSYGGELILRIVLYGLPILAILGADALRSMVRKRRSLEWVLAVGMVVLMGLLVVIRGGNDSFQVVFPQEVTMYRQVVAETPPGQTISSTTTRSATPPRAAASSRPIRRAAPRRRTPTSSCPSPRWRRKACTSTTRSRAGRSKRFRRSSPRAATRSPTRTATTGSSGRSPSPQRERVAER